MAVGCFDSMPRSLDDLRSPVFWRDVLIEVLVSCMLLTWITFALTTCNDKLYTPNTTNVGLVVGFLVFILIEVFGPFSGCHMNPAVTLGFFLTGRMSWARGILYVVAQCAGGASGSAMVFALTPEKNRQFKPFGPAEGMTLTQAIGCEVIFTFFLVSAALCTSIPERKSILPGFPTGFCVGTSIMAGGTFTGAVLNPIVSLGPSVITKNFTYHWIYWIGTMIGATLAFMFYRASTLIGDKYTKNNNNQDQLKEKRDHLAELLEEFMEEKIASRKAYLEKLPQNL